MHKFLAPLYFLTRISLLGLVLIVSSISILSPIPLIALDKVLFSFWISSCVSGIFKAYLINPLLTQFSISKKISPKFFVYILHKLSFFSSKK